MSSSAGRATRCVIRPPPPPSNGRHILLMYLFLYLIPSTIANYVYSLVLFLHSMWIILARWHQKVPVSIYSRLSASPAGYQCHRLCTARTGFSIYCHVQVGLCPFCATLSAEFVSYGPNFLSSSLLVSSEPNHFLQIEYIFRHFEPVMDKLN